MYGHPFYACLDLQSMQKRTLLAVIVVVGHFVTYFWGSRWSCVFFWTLSNMLTSKRYLENRSRGSAWALSRSQVLLVFMHKTSEIWKMPPNGGCPKQRQYPELANEAFHNRGYFNKPGLSISILRKTSSHSAANRLCPGTPGVIPEGVLVEQSLKQGRPC